MKVSGKATVFATHSDFLAYNKAIAEGKSQNEAFDLGDNCIGCYGDPTGPDTGCTTPGCAITPDKMIAIYGSIAAAKHQLILVTYNGVSVEAKILDRMPWEKDVDNSAILDMNPILENALGVHGDNVSLQVDWENVARPLSV